MAVERLAMAAWERYMACDHGPSHSMTCFARFWFDGTFDRDRFTQALIKLADRHFLLAATVESGCWVRQRFDPAKQIFWQAFTDTPEYGHLEPDDFLVRFLVHSGTSRENQNRTLLIIQFHHAVCDGKAIFQLLEQIDQLMNQQPVDSPSVAALNERHHFGISWWQRFARLGLDLKRIVPYFWRSPIGLKTRPRLRDQSLDQISNVAIRLSEEFSESIRQRAKLRGVSVNDLLLASVFKTFVEYVNEGTVRIGVPIAMRTKHNYEFCNLVSMVFLDRSTTAIAKPDLLEQVSSEMREVLGNDLGHAMISFLKPASRLRGSILKRLLQLRGGAPTIVVTNLGNPFRDQEGFGVGAARMTSFDTLPPIRPGTDLALSVNYFGGRNSFTLRYHPAAMTESMAREFVCRLPLMMVELLGETTAGFCVDEELTPIRHDR